MSVQAATWVWKHSQATGGTLLVALAIADAANAEGENSCQAVSTIAQMTRTSESTVHRAITWLLDRGELQWVGVNQHYRNTRIYRFALMSDRGVTMTPLLSQNGVGGVSSATDRGVTHDTRTQRDNPKEQNLLSATPTEWDSEPTKRTQTLAPDSFPITPHLRDWWAKKRRPDIDLLAETERFLDWHRVNGKRRVDWTRAWQNWMNRVADRQPSRQQINNRETKNMFKGFQ
jgi:hypothetical protein